MTRLDRGVPARPKSTACARVWQLDSHSTSTSSPSATGPEWEAAENVDDADDDDEEDDEDEK